MKTVIEMAREAGLFTHKEVQPELERFAELVRADERERIYFQNSSDFVKAAVLTEREACARVCEELLERPSGYQGTWEGYGKFKTQMTGQECAAAIRARSNT
jgi:hypothetical protein